MPISLLDDSHHKSGEYKSQREEESRLKQNEKLIKALGGTNKIPANWLLTREEMLQTPPKILITNYAMLEHLLLLPRNAPLFYHNTLQSIVLDEVHPIAEHKQRKSHFYCEAQAIV